MGLRRPWTLSRWPVFATLRARARYTRVGHLARSLATAGARARCTGRAPRYGGRGDAMEPPTCCTRVGHLMGLLPWRAWRRYGTPNLLYKGRAPHGSLAMAGVETLWNPKLAVQGSGPSWVSCHGGRGDAMEPQTCCTRVGPLMGLLPWRA